MLLWCYWCSIGVEMVLLTYVVMLKWCYWRGFIDEVVLIWCYWCNTGVEMLARLKFGRKYVSALFTMLAHLKFGEKYVALLSFGNMCHSWHLCEPAAESPLARQASHRRNETQYTKHCQRYTGPRYCHPLTRIQPLRLDANLAKFAIIKIKLFLWRCFTIGF